MVAWGGIPVDIDEAHEILLKWFNLVKSEFTLRTRVGMGCWELTLPHVFF